MDQHPVVSGAELRAFDYLDVHMVDQNVQLGGHEVLEATSDLHCAHGPTHRHGRLDEVGLFGGEVLEVGSQFG